MADKLISELIEVINAVVNNDEEAELDLKEIETVLIAAEVEIKEKDVKIKEIEREVKKLGKEIEVLTESNENNVEVVDSLKNENKELREVLTVDLRQRCVWLKEVDTLEVLKESPTQKEMDIEELFKLKKEIDKKFNKVYNPDSEIQLDSDEIDSCNPADFDI